MVKRASPSVQAHGKPPLTSVDIALATAIEVAERICSQHTGRVCTASEVGVKEEFKIKEICIKETIFIFLSSTHSHKQRFK